MKIEFTRSAADEFAYWKAHDPRMVKRILRLLQSIRESPFQGVGKPEALRGNLSGYWSRRIDRQHRLVYRVSGGSGEEQTCLVVQCRFCYD